MGNEQLMQKKEDRWFCFLRFKNKVWQCAREEKINYLWPREKGNDKLRQDRPEEYRRLMTIKIWKIKLIVFPLIMYGYESWTLRKKTDPFELLIWRSFLRVL